MNTYIDRTIEKKIINNLFKGKVIIVYGPRQSGKTTMVKRIIDGRKAKYLLCEVPEINQTLESQNVNEIIKLFDGSELIALDEAQTVRNIGRVLKLLVDLHPEIQVIATGSSSFELSNEIVEPLTGRKFEYILYPLSVQEVSESLGYAEYLQLESSILRYGLYPGVLNNSESEKLLLEELASSYLFKDILAFQDIRNSELLMRLLQMLALQIGSEVSFTELASSLGVDQVTVQRYVDLLEKTFVIYRVVSFSRNLRKELNKKRKIYFYDLGIRNALIRNFNELSLRNDAGSIWENFVVTERIKFQKNNSIFANHYFWRTWDKKEIDLIEEIEGKLHGYEIKLKAKKSKAPTEWLRTYDNATFEEINKSNYFQFVTSPHLY